MPFRVLYEAYCVTWSVSRWGHIKLHTKALRAVFSPVKLFLSLGGMAKIMPFRVLHEACCVSILTHLH